MLIATSTASLTTDLDARRRKGGARRCVSLVVTGGDVHLGHQALISAARSLSDIVVVAIAPGPERGRGNVVTAGQFQDIALIEQANVDFLYTPPEAETLHLQMPGAFTLRLPAGYPLCGNKQSMAQTLLLTLRFMNTVQPDVIVCGERHYLQYRLLRQLVSDLGVRTQVQCIPTVRDANGVALCANNGKLNANQTDHAPVLYQTLNNVAHAIRTGARNFEKLEHTARIALRGAGFRINSFAIYDDETLGEPKADSQAFRIIGNINLGSYNLHDNLGLSL